MKQFVYCQKPLQAFEVPSVVGAEFKLLTSPWDAIQLGAVLKGCFGLIGLIKTAVKVAAGKRRFYCVLAEGRIAHYGWISFSFCRHYKVQVGDVVIGPISTAGAFCGRGYATWALMQVMNSLMKEGYRIYWIDTAENNMACLKVIEKCRFGRPVSTYERPKGDLQ